MSPRSRIIILGIGLLSLGTMAIAAQPSGSTDRRSPPARAELQTKLEQKFDAMDANRDGTLTPQERRAAMAAGRDARRASMFATLDSNHDGVLSPEEFAAIHRDRAAGARSDADGAVRGARHHRAGRDGVTPWRALAAYRDKPITRTQFVEAGLTRFDRIDTDHDGVISSAERDAARVARRERRAPATPLPPSPGQ